MQDPSAPEDQPGRFKRFFSRNKNQPGEAELAAEDASESAAVELQTPVPTPAVSDMQAEPAEDAEQGFLSRMKSGLSKTRSSFATGLANVLVGKKEIDEDIFEEIETQLLVADVGMEATLQIVASLTERVSRKELIDADALYDALQEELEKLLAPAVEELVIEPQAGPFVILVVGINGAGKTTTIGKLAKRFQQQGKSVMLAAGDTFRAAAVEQLEVWGERNNIQVVAQHTGADSASVIFDGLNAAKARGVDVLIADTAGRLHNKSHLMDELTKVKRVMAKLDSTAPHEVMLVIDAGTGQNALQQVDEFHRAVGLTGLTITKLDGTAKGGIVFALAKKAVAPIRYIGVGEKIDDLRPFTAKDFIQALFD